MPDKTGNPVSLSPVATIRRSPSHQDDIVTENTRSFTTRAGWKVTIAIDDSGEEILVTDSDGKEIGSITLSFIECDHFDYYRITWMYLNKQGNRYLRQGIGRAALTFHKECFDAPIEASDDDGIVKSDGSHLTGDAPEFIRKMREEGLVLASSFDVPYEDDD